MARRLASTATRCETTLARRCARRGGGRGRGRGLGRRGLAPRGASGGCCRPACGTPGAAACCSPSESRRPCACPTRLRPPPGPRRRRARPGLGSGRGSRRSRLSSSAAVITVPLNNDRKICPSGCSWIAVAIWRSSSVICALSVLIIATRLHTSCRRVASSSSPTLPSGACLSLASSCSGFCRPE